MDSDIIRRKLLTQDSASSVEARTHGPDWKVEGAGDLVVLKALNAELDYAAILVRQARDGGLHDFEQFALSESLFWIAYGTGHGRRHGGRILPTLSPRFGSPSM